MRKIHILVVLTGLLCFQSCSKFLDLTPTGIQVVSRVEDYRDILASYMRLLKTPNPSAQVVMGENFKYPLFNVGVIGSFATGEFDLNQENKALYDPLTAQYTSSATQFLTWLGPTLSNPFWSRYFNFIGSLNVILGGIPTAEGDDQQLRDYVTGEALVWRAFSYFKLTQYYCPRKGNEYGLPLHLKPYEDPANAMPKRETQTDTYKRILDDCNEALNLLKRTPSQKWNYAYHPRFIYGMLASIYCYKATSAAAEESDWKNAVYYADLATGNRPLVRDVASYKMMFDCVAQKVYDNDEFYFRLVDGNNRQIFDCKGVYYFQGGAYGGQGSSSTPPEVMDLFRDGDIRKEANFIGSNGKLWKTDKYNISKAGNNGGGIIMLFRLAESYLIKAEGLCRMGKMDEAKKVLDKFKEARYADVKKSYTNTELLDEILKERKIEFYCEQDMWWFDMKRLGVEMTRTVNGIINRLSEDDFRYTYPIPQQEIKTNFNMVQNLGWEEIYI